MTLKNKLHFYYNDCMGIRLILSILIILVCGTAFSFFDFKEVNMDVFVSNLNNVSNIYRGDMLIYSKYLDEFITSTYGISNDHCYVSLLSNHVSINIESSNTNFTISILPIPLYEVLDTIFYLSYKLNEFSKFYIGDYGSVKIFKLPFKKGKNYFYIYFSNGKIERIDLWMKENEEILVWSALIAFDLDKGSNTYLLSSILVNIGANQFYKFDFRKK